MLVPSWSLRLKRSSSPSSPQNIQDKLDGEGKKTSPQRKGLFETIKRQRADQVSAYRPAYRDARMAQTAETLRADRSKGDERFYRRY